MTNSEHDAIIVTCPFCDGSGAVEGMPHDVCRQTGAPICMTYRCSACGGTGSVEEEIIPAAPFGMADEDADQTDGGYHAERS